MRAALSIVGVCGCFAVLGACNGGLSDSSGSSGSSSLTGASTQLPPVAAFSVQTPAIGVAPLVVQFAQSDDAQTNDWRWSFGDGQGCTSQLSNGVVTGTCGADPSHPTHTYTVPGVYAVSLRAAGPGGARFEQLENLVEVLEPPPIAQFSASNTSGTIPITVTFTNTSTNAKDFVWDFGDGTSSTAANPQKTYGEGNFGDFVVTLTALGPGGNDTARPLLVHAIAPVPYPEFVMESGSTTGTVISGALPLTVHFTQTPDPAHPTFSYTTSRVWTFGDIDGDGDIDTSTAESPTVIYRVPSLFNVSLHVTGPGGMATSASGKTVEAYDPIADGSFEMGTVGQAPGPPLAGAPVIGDPWRTFTGTLGGASNHTVQPGAGSPTSELGMPSGLGSRWCVIDSVSTSNATPPSPTNGLPETTLASGGAGIVQTFSYRGTSSVLKFEPVFIADSTFTSEDDWMSIDVTKGNETRNVFFAHATMLTGGNTAGDSALFSGTQYTHVPGTVTAPLATMFSGTSIQTVFTLRVQVGNRINALHPSRGYVDSFRLEPVGGVNGMFTGSPTGTLQSDASHTFNVQFTAGTTGNPNQWSWDFGDGAVPATSTAQDPTCRYTTTGNKNVTLMATRVVGGEVISSATFSQPGFVRVFPQPTASFTKSVDCSQGIETDVSLICDRAPVAIGLTNTSNSATNTLPGLTYQWIIDGVSQSAGGIGTTFSYVETAGGTHDYRLRVVTPPLLLVSLPFQSYSVNSTTLTETLSNPASFSTVYSNVLATDCVSCHSSGTPDFNQNGAETVQQAQNRIRDYFLNTNGCGGYRYVTASSLGNSFLWQQVAINTASSGTCANRRMPPSSAPSTTAIDIVRSWIAIGAPPP